MWKNQGVKDTKTHHSCENFWASRIVFPMFFGICKIKKNYQWKSSVLKHAVVNNNNFSVKMESRIVTLFKISFNITNSWNHKSKSQKSKVVSSVLHDIIAWQIFAPRRKIKISYISIPYISIHLFKHFYFFCFVSTQFTHFAYPLKYKCR